MKIGKFKALRDKKDPSWWGHPQYDNEITISLIPRLFDEEITIDRLKDSGVYGLQDYDLVDVEIMIPDNIETQKKYSCALVYQNNTGAMLRTIHTLAHSEQEALGKAIEYFNNETKGYGLVMKSVLQFLP